MTTDTPPNPTAIKFGFPATMIHRYQHWLILARPQQITLGSLVLLCTDQARAFSEISRDAFQELARVTADLDRALKATFNPDKLNYLMLMMVDPDVHFHVLPRYAGEVEFAGRTFADRFWPKPVDVTQPVADDAALVEAVKSRLASVWPQSKS